MASIDQLKSQRWRVRYRSGGRTIPAMFDTEVEALAFKRQIEAAGRTGKAPEASSMAYFDWLCVWFERQRVTSRISTVQTYKSALNRHVVPDFGVTRLTDITPGALADWQVGLTHRMNASSANHIRTIFATTLKAAVDDGHLARNPFQSVKRLRAPKRSYVTLNREEVFELAEKAPARYETFILLAGICGLRNGELCALQVDGFDRSDGTLSINGTVTDNPGGPTFHVGPPKTDHGYRTLHLPSEIYHRVIGHIDAGYGTTDGKWLFANRRGGPMSTQYVANYLWHAGRGTNWAEAVAEAGHPGLRVHDLRHSAISNWVRAGIAVTLIAEWAGHGSVSYVLDTYGHNLDEDRRAAADKVLALS